VKTPMPVLGAKLLPPGPGPFHLRRERLHQRLARGLEGRATAVVAGPGYGKSTLVARFLQETSGDTVWYSLDPSDRDPAIFFRYLMQGLREHAPEFGLRIEWMWKESRTGCRKPEQLADIFIGEAEESLGGRFVVVLDQIDRLEGSPGAARALRRLLAWLPGTLHLVLVGRSLPDIGLKGLEGDGQVAVIGGDDLRFTEEETRALLAGTFGLSMPDEAIRRVHARTRGWVTALQLLRQTAHLRPGAAGLPEEVFERTEPEIFDWFTARVLEGLPEEARAFLLGSAPPPTFDPDLLAEVLEGVDARAVLQDLLRRNLFLAPLESRGAHFAYDPLFRDYLLRRLQAERGREERRALERRYSRAFARRREFAPALEHALAAEDARGAADLLARQGKGLLHRGRIDLVREACGVVARTGHASPVVDDLLGEASRLAGDYAAAIPHFERALAASEAAGGAGPHHPGLAGPARASTLQGLAYALLETGALPRAAETAERALAEAGDGEPALLARTLNTLALVHYRSDRHDAALARWQEALARARQAGDEHLTLMIAHNLGLPHAVRGDFRRASECFRILTAPENIRVGPEEGAAYLNLARIAILRGEWDRAASLLGDAREISQKLRLPALQADVLEAEGTLLRETGDAAGAAERYALARARFTGLGRMDLLDGLAEEEAILLARTGRCAEAFRILAPVVERVRAAAHREGLASALLAAGETAVRAGQDERAVTALEESAAIFTGLNRAYPSCLAHAWLALARRRQGAEEPAVRAAETALRISTRFDYEAALLRVAAVDAGFRGWLGARDGAPAALHVAVEAGAGTVPRSAPPQGTADLTVHLFGPVEVFHERGQAIPPRAWKIRRALTIFCYLAVARDRRATKERIVDALWGDARPAVIEKNFHPTISFLRRALNDGHNVPRHFILFERGAYRLNPAYRYDIDAERFEAGLREARRTSAGGDAAGALAAFDAALALYRGPFLEEEYDEWIEGPRAHYEVLMAAALREAGRLHVERGDAAAGLAYLARAVSQDPIDEAASVDLMQALGRCGRRAEIEKEHERLRRALLDGLSAVPSAVTRQAFERALRLAAEPPPGPAGAAGRGRRESRVVH
jgi:ATP/maltotriose-dependent transcriptional regulator MalT/DNA-binding SARP family transcriptional activator